MARKFAAVVFSLGCVQASSVWALGLGEMNLDSYLNEPLKAQVDLLNIGGLHQDQIKIRLATKDDFKRMGVDRAYFLTSIVFDVQIDDSGSARIVITSEDPVLEPYLDFILEARWPSGRLLREYTVLVDPPVFDEVNPVISASSRVAEVDGVPEPAKKKTEVVGTTGTRVDIRDSRLAPGEMPSRAFGATASSSPAPGQRYMIHRDDTLWDIASRGRPSGASVNQTMLDIQRLNPDAFIRNNINRIKAGYIVYLPSESEISGGQSQAQAEVRQQNQEWLEGKSSEPDYGSGPSLRISAEPEDGAAAEAAPKGEVAASAAAMEDLEKAGLERVELEQRLASMEQQVETLERIVRLKDDQIAALQGVLADDQTADGAALPAAEAIELAVAEAEEANAELEAVPEDSVPEESVPEVVAVEVDSVEQEPAPAEVAPAPRAPAEKKSQGFFSNLWFVLGAVVLAVLGIIFMRRRRGDTDGDSLEGGASETAPDVFANVELTEQALQVEDNVESAAQDSEKTATGEVVDRGYGRRKHDEYASDEASDALAEAEIYIAYGRYPQAIDLLKNALVNDGDNTAYRLKLLELYQETGNRSAATEQLTELETIGDGPSIAEARALLGGVNEPETPNDDLASVAAAGSAGLLADSSAALESDFSGLEIEELGSDSIEDELDLSADFDDTGVASGKLEEELVIAAESNGMSTKLDLARAYMDMGDDDGARQILEEVAAEGNEQLQAEARALLERIG